MAERGAIPLRGENSRPFQAGRFSLAFGEPTWGRPEEEYPAPASLGERSARMILCLSGKSTVELDGVAFNAERGTVLYADSLTAVRWREVMRQETQLFCVPFWIWETAEDGGQPHTLQLASLLGGRNFAVGVGPSLCDYSDFLKRRVADESRVGFDNVLFAFLLDAAFVLSQSTDMRTDRERIVVYARAHARQKLTVGDLARFLSMSDRALFYFFKKNFGISPNDFINRIRVSAASEYLSRGLSVREVSEIFHFSEVTAFSRIYKKYFGMTPGEYRKHIAEDSMSSATGSLQGSAPDGKEAV